LPAATRLLPALLLAAVTAAGAGCQTGSLRGEPEQVTRTPTDADAPFGGGFPADHRPGGDPFGANERRTELRVESRPAQARP
jgi:hypothetical protein